MPITLQNNPGRYKISNAAPENYVFGFDSFLYHSPVHLKLQPSNILNSFFLLDNAAKQILAQLHVLEEDNTGHSPLKGHFGSIQSAPHLSVELVYFFVQEVLGLLQKQNLRYLELVHFPTCYAPEETGLVMHVLLALGLKIKSSQINHHISVTAKQFSDGLHISSRRRLEKCRNAGFRFQKIEENKLTEVYNFILACREERGIGLSLALEDLQTLFRTFPDNYFLLGVLDGVNLAAATVAVKVNNSILYNFYPASPLSYNKFSPVVMLNEGLYNFSTEQKFRILDLGISARPGSELFSLMEFKQRLGGVISNKFIFEYTFPAQPNASI